MIRKRGALATCAVLSLALVASDANADTFCWKDVEPDEDPSTSYKNRESRCEGLYKRQNAAEQLAIVSVLETTDAGPIGKRSGSALRLAWPKSAPLQDWTEIAIQASADVGGRHYRMDTRKELSSDHYDWPSEILDKLKLPEKRVSLLAYIRGKTHNDRTIYVPLRVGELSSPATAFLFLVRPRKDVERASYSIERWEKDKWVVVKESRPLPEDVRVPGQPFAVKIPISEVPDAGVLYVLRLSATLDQRPASSSAVFFHR